MDDRFEVPAEVVARRVHDEMVLLDLDSGTYFGLDPVGARIWDLVSEGLTLSAVCERMLGEYDVSRETLEHDVLRLVDALTKENLLRLCR